MTDTHTSGNSGALGFYIAALVIVLGIVVGIATMGLAGLTLWMVALTFIVLAAMLILPQG